jgi:signal transduction histidine kinase
LEDANRDIERRRLEAARLGAEEERLRIAGELHDVVAHRVSMIVVQSQAADALLETDPVAARRAVRSVEDAARRALTELRQVVDVLTHDEQAATVGTDLGGIRELVEEAAAAGLPVTFDREGRERPVPPVVALAAYRIVQEALTNVVRHAGGAPARVRLCVGEHEVEVTVEDDGPGPATSTPGHGLSGMAERAAFIGGRLTAGAGQPRGFRVHAVLPIPQEAR